MCGVSVEQMRAWVFDGRTLQRAAVGPLVGLLHMSPVELVQAARRSPRRDGASGSVLRVARRARRLTQDELGQRVGVAGETVSHWERGTWIPPVHQVFRLARVLRHDAWQLGEGLGLHRERLSSVLGVDVLTSQRRERAGRVLAGGSSHDGMGEQAGGQRCA